MIPENRFRYSGLLLQCCGSLWRPSTVMVGSCWQRSHHDSRELVRDLRRCRWAEQRNLARWKGGASHADESRGLGRLLPAKSAALPWICPLRPESARLSRSAAQTPAKAVNLARPHARPEDQCGCVLPRLPAVVEIQSHFRTGPSHKNS